MIAAIGEVFTQSQTAGYPPPPTVDLRG